MQATALVLVMTLAPADASPPVDGPPPPSAVTVNDAGELQGQWEVVGCVEGRKDQSHRYKGGRWRFTGMSLVIDAKVGIKGSHDIQVDPYCDPPAVDQVMLHGLPLAGIYRRFGDELIWAEERTTRERPASFEPVEGFVVWTLRRVKK